MAWPLSSSNVFAQSLGKVHTHGDDCRHHTHMLSWYPFSERDRTAFRLAFSDSTKKRGWTKPVRLPFTLYLNGKWKIWKRYDQQIYPRFKQIPSIFWPVPLLVAAIVAWLGDWSWTNWPKWVTVPDHCHQNCVLSLGPLSNMTQLVQYVWFIQVAQVAQTNKN